MEDGECEVVKETKKVSGDVEEDLEEARIVKENKQIELGSKTITLGIHRCRKQGRKPIVSSKALLLVQSQNKKASSRKH